MGRAPRPANGPYGGISRSLGRKIEFQATARAGRFAYRSISPPPANDPYWLPKLERNRERDHRSAAALRAMGWRVLAIWECEVPDEAAAAALLEPFLGESG